LANDITASIEDIVQPVRLRGNYKGRLLNTRMVSQPAKASNASGGLLADKLIGNQPCDGDTPAHHASILSPKGANDPYQHACAKECHQ
jgi:hypothetical protein